MSEGEEGRLEVPDGAVSEARRFHEERGGKGGGVFVHNLAEGRDLHATCLVGPPTAQTRGF